MQVQLKDARYVPLDFEALLISPQSNQVNSFGFYEQSDNLVLFYEATYLGKS